jgi:MFS family permease
MLEVVRHPQLRRAEVSFACAWTSEAAFTVSLGVVAFRDGGAASVGLVAIIRLLPSALLSPLVVGVADRIRRERVLAVLSTLRAAVLLLAALLVRTDAPIALLYALAMVATVAFTVYRPVHSALLPSLCTTTRELTSSNVVRGFLDSAGTLVGPALAGILLAVGDASVVFAACAGLSFAAAVTLTRLVYEVPPSGEPGLARSLVRETADGVAAVFGHRELTLVFGLGFAQAFVRGALNVFTVVVAFEMLDSGESGAATLAAAVGAGGVLGALVVSLLVGSRHLGAWLAVALTLWGAPIALLGSEPAPALAIALLAIVGLGNAIIDVPLFTLPVRLVPDAVLARVFGVFESLVALAVGLGSIATPVILGALDLRWALVVEGTLLPVLAVVWWHHLRALDARLAVRDREIDVLRAAPMLGQLPVPSIEHLATRVRRLDLPAAHVVLEQGGTGGGFYVIDEGEVEVVGDGRVLNTLGPGDSFGEIALLHDVPRTATIRARTPLTVFELDPDAFLDAVGGFRQSSDTAYAVVAQRLASFRPAGISS